MILVKKLTFFHRLSLSKKDREKVFANVLDKKKAFKDYKNNCLLTTQNWNFSKGVSPKGLVVLVKNLKFFQL